MNVKTQIKAPNGKLGVCLNFACFCDVFENVFGPGQLKLKILFRAFKMNKDWLRQLKETFPRNVGFKSVKSRLLITNALSRESENAKSFFKDLAKPGYKFLKHFIKT